MIPVETNLLTLLRQHAALTPDAPCLTFGEETLGFGTFDARASRVAHALAAQGVREGDRVAIIARNWPAQFELFFGCAKEGAICLPINWRLAPREIAGILGDSTPALLIVEETLVGLLAETPAPPATIRLADYPGWRDAGSAADKGTLPAPDTPAANPLHLRHDRPAKRRGAQPPQPLVSGADGA